ncbi:MAG: transketolase [Bacilli bacterium]
MSNIDLKAIDTLRVLSIEQSTKAKSGHPGIALGAAPIIHTLYTKVMNINPAAPDWINRDRFILAAGHGSSLLYSVLHLSNYGLTIADLKDFRQYNSKTPGHPEIVLTKGVDATSGPLGQGIPAAVGMAIAEEFLRNKFNKDSLELINHYTYVLCGDGDLQEGVTAEAMSLAGHLGLSKLIVLYDSNDIQLDTEVSETNSENVKAKYEAMNWNHILVKDGEDIVAIEAAINKAKSSTKPTLIEVKTIIGRGTTVANTPKAHGSPLSSEEALSLRNLLGGEPFEVSSEVKEYYKQNVVLKGEKTYSTWVDVKNNYTYMFPHEAEEFKKVVDNDFHIDFENLVEFDNKYNKATRVSGGAILDALSKLHPTIMGGSADLASSTKAKGADGNFSSKNRLGRNINFGVREHAMAAISNGIALHKGIKVFCSGFFVFSDYMKPAMRLASIMELPVTYIFTHDSVAVGEDGATHQPIEQLSMLRSMPHFNVIRPADAFEALYAWKNAYNSKDTPTALILTRQDVPVISTKEDAKYLEKGAYVIRKEDKKVEGVILASGSEVSLAIEVSKELKRKGHDIRVVSMPSIYLYEKQSKEYKESVIPTNVKNIMAIEASEAVHYYKYLGSTGKLYNINKYGASAPGDIVMSNCGFNVQDIVSSYLEMVKDNRK